MTLTKIGEHRLTIEDMRECPSWPEFVPPAGQPVQFSSLLLVLVEEGGYGQLIFDLWIL